MLALLRLVLVAFLGLSSYRSAAKTVRPWTHFGIRPLGMGNAFVSIADDYNALFYNPAGLARLGLWDGELVSIRPSMSKDSIDLFQKVLNGSSSLTGSIDDSLDLIQENLGKSQFASVAYTPHLVFQNFGFGVGLEAVLSFTAHRQPTIEIKSGVEMILPVSFAFNLLDNKLSIGLTLKTRAQAAVDSEFSMTDIEALSNKDEDNGSQLSDFILGGYGSGADIGLLFTPTKILSPTIGISITDIGGTSFKNIKIGSVENRTPNIVLPSVNVGLSLKPYERKRSYIRTAIDMHSINQPHSFSKKLHFGAEYGYGSFFKAQVGLHQGYLTAGLGFDAGVTYLRLATYSTELGQVAGQGESRRYAFQIKILI